MYYLTNFCCFCLKEREKLVDLSSRNFENVNIVNKLMFCVKDDLDTSKIPTFICLKCCAKLEEAYEFKKMSLGNWNRFQGYIRKLKYVNPNCKTKYVLNKIKILVSDLKSEGFEFKTAFVDDNSTDEYFKNGVATETIESLSVEDENNGTSEESEQLTNENNELSSSEYKEEMEEDINKNDGVPHIGIIHNEATIPDGLISKDLFYRCSICGICFKSKVNLNLHSIIHSNISMEQNSKSDRILATDGHLKRHFKNLHLSKLQRMHGGQVKLKKIPCSLCYKSFSSETGLNMHMQTHENKRPFACSYCDKTFWKRYLRELHFAKYHEVVDPDNLYSCYECKERFPSELKLKEHVLIHTEEKPFMCPKCGRGFTLETNYHRHLHIHNEKDRPRFDCSICKKSFTAKFSLKIHMLAHFNKRPFACTMCDKTFCKKYLLDNHVLRHNSTDNHVEQSQECETEFQTNESRQQEENLLKSVKIESSDSFEFVDIQILNMKTEPVEEPENKVSDQENVSLPKPCTFVTTLEESNDVKDENFEEACVILDDREESNKSVGTLKEMFDKSSLEFRYQDVSSSLDTSKSFTPVTNAENLNQSVNSEAQYLCSECGKSYTTRRSMLRHLEYIRAGSVVCPLCKKSFRTKCVLALHHCVKRPYACVRCGKSFRTNKDVAHHTRVVHLNYRPYPCSMCGKGFVGKYDLYRHTGSCRKRFEKLKGNMSTHNERLPNS